MLRIVVRAKKDGDAVKASIKTFYEDWNIEVATLKGERRPEKIVEALRDIPGDRLTLFLAGREEQGVLDLASSLPFHIVVHPVKYKKVRNARTIVIAREIERGKARLRLGARWDPERGVYLFDHRGRQIFSEVKPAYDIFLPLSGETLKLLGDLLGRNLSNPILLRKMGGLHEVYDCGVSVGRLVFPDQGRPTADVTGESRECPRRNLDKIVSVNLEELNVLEYISLKFLRDIEDVKRVYVPLSGGKDSAAALLLATKVWGDRVKAVYVDTGVDFAENKVSAENIADALNVELDTVYAPVREEIIPRGLPTHEERWCTGLKVAALHRYLKDHGADGHTVVVVGDRDAESRSRSRRPPLRREEGWKVAAPLKLWGSHQVMLYLLAEKVPINPLYEWGFYRTGCYICPSLRGWELYVMERKGVLERLKSERPGLMLKFLASKKWLPSKPD